MAKLDDAIKHLQENTITFTTHLLSKPKERIVFRPVKTKDEKQLIISKAEVEGNEIDNFMTLISLVDACLVNNNIPLDDFALQDFISILLDIKTKSFGETVELVATCTHCKHDKNDITLDFTKDVHKTKFEKIVDNEINLTNNMKVILGLITVGDFLSILEFADDDIRKIASYAAMIKTVELGKEVVDIETIEQKMSLIDEMNKDQLSKFKEFDTTNKIDIKAVKTYVCANPECRKENTVTMTGFDIINFF